jgi:tRNA U55 pseudouridine synthase TruB
LEEKKPARIDRKTLTGILNSMKGEYLQKIPSYSAKKIKGKHMYDYARKGIAIEEIKNNVEIYDIKLLSFNSGEFCIKIFCSSGTYIRSIAADLGERLGCGAVLSKLKRIKIGQFNIIDSVKPDEVVLLGSRAATVNIMNNCCNYKYIVPVSSLAERNKTIYVYKKYFPVLKNNSPLYKYMINLNKTKKRLYEKNDVFSIKHSGSAEYFIHKAVIDFKSCNLAESDEKLSKFISAVSTNQDSI